MVPKQTVILIVIPDSISLIFLKMNFHGISSAVVLVMANEVSRNSVTINSVLNDSMIFSCVTAVFCDSLMGNAIMCRTLARCISRSEYFGRRFASCKSMAPLSTGFA